MRYCEHETSTGRYKKKENCYICSPEGKIKTLMQKAKARAIKQNIDYDLDFNYVYRLYEETKGKCPVLGFKFFSGSRATSASIDRLIPERGYIHGNISIISYLANAVRSSATSEQIRKVADYAASVEKG